MPPERLLPDRLDAVLAVVYLIFNQGYGGRGDLAAEALWLGRALAGLEIVDPGFTPVCEWRPEDSPADRPVSSDLGIYAAVARKP